MQAAAPSGPPAPGARLVCEDSIEIQLTGFPRDFGRNDVLRLTQENGKISKNHLRFYYENGQFMVEDTDSLNGTKLNDEVIGGGRKGLGKRPLKDGDVIELAIDEKKKGLVRLTFRTGS